MFKENDHVVYPGIGVCKITSTTTLANKAFLKLSASNGVTIIIPASSQDGEVVRKLASNKDITTAFKILKTPARGDLPKKISPLERIILSKFKSGSIFEIADMVGLLYRFKKQRRLSVNEMRYLDMGLTQLIDEISLAKSISKEEAEREIYSSMN